jgi:hypothetical protein
MGEAKGGDVRIVDFWAGESGAAGEPGKCRKVGDDAEELMDSCIF